MSRIAPEGSGSSYRNLADEPRAFRMPSRARSAGAVLGMMAMLLSIAAGVYDTSVPLPPPPMLDEEDMRAGSIHTRECVDFWLDFILPNSQLTDKQNRLVERVLRNGAQWVDMRRTSGATVGTTPNRRMPNHVIVGMHPDGTRSLHDWITEQLANYERIGAIRYCAPEDIDVVNPIGVEPTKPRLITDMRYVNLWCEPTPFRYGSLTNFRRELRQDDLLITVDLKDAFHHVRINEDALRAFGGRWMGRTFMFTALPFKFNCSPVIFQTHGVYCFRAVNTGYSVHGVLG